MTPRHQETALPPGPLHQPVRFYKIVALTFLGLTILLLGLVVFMSTKRATITIMTKTTSVDVNTTLEIGHEGSGAALSGVVTTTVVTLEKFFAVSGSREEPAIVTGLVTLENDSTQAQPLVKTTRLLSPDGILFRLTEGATVPAKGSVEVSVYSDTTGKSNNIEPTRFTIPGLNQDRQKQVYATSKVAMTGGVRVVGVLSEEDIAAAEIVWRQALLEEGTRVLREETGEEYAAVVELLRHETVVDEEIGQEVNGFTLRGAATVLGIFYREADLADRALKQLATRAVDDTELIEAGKEPFTVTFQSYSESENNKIATVNLFSAGRATLNPESEQLRKPVFFGKNRDEVRRYLLTLDHVNGVEVKFRPAWVTHVPHVADHVRVVVQKVE